MKKLFPAIMISIMISTVPVYSQIGGVLNKAKNAAVKPNSEKTSKTNDSKDVKSTESTKTENNATTPNTTKQSPEVKPAVIATGKFSDIIAGMVNATLEQQAIKLVTEKATNENWKEKYTKAKIVSTNWEIEKNEYTSEIICRKIYMKLYGVWPEGKCEAVDFGFKQDYIGDGKYSDSLIYNGIGDMTSIICE
jgi:hypothetical protein